MKKDGDKILRGKSLGLEKLHRSIVGTDVEGRLNKLYIIIEIYISIAGAHRALPDVLAMERVLTHPSLVRCLPNLDIRSPAKQMRLWIQQKRVHTRITALVKALGTPSVTAAQARRLDNLGLGIQELLKLHKDIDNPEEFLTRLKERGVNSKILREKLVKTLQQFK